MPTNWRNILEEFDRDTMEYDWAANVLPLPCDQRYGAEEMQYIADSIREMGGNGIMKHRLLILGTLGEFEQLVQKAREKGYYTIVCDGYPDGPARKFADEAFQIPVTDTERIACLCREKEIDGILTSFSDLLLECMVKIADRAGIPC